MNIHASSRVDFGPLYKSANIASALFTTEVAWAEVIAAQNIAKSLKITDFDMASELLILPLGANFDSFV